MATLSNPEKAKRWLLTNPVGAVRQPEPTLGSMAPRGSQLRPKPAVSGLKRKLSKRGLMVAALGIFLSFVLVMAIIAVFGGPTSDKETREYALKSSAIQAVKNEFGPNYAMLALNPDTSTGHWFAIDNAGVYQCSGECLVVIYSVEVMPIGATESKTMDFKWLYDTNRPLAVPANTATRTYFQASISGSSEQPDSSSDDWNQ